jgi:hypothetical protein
VGDALREWRINNRDRRRDGEGATSRSQPSAELEQHVPISAVPDVLSSNRDFCCPAIGAPGRNAPEQEQSGAEKHFLLKEVFDLLKYVPESKERP